MRVVTFKSILDAVLRRLGIDPDSGTVSHDTVRALAEHIGNRIRTGWAYYSWPELSTTQERALRPLWFADRSYRKGAEVFYLPSRSYYCASAAIAAGIVPGTAGSNWQGVIVTDRFLAYEQDGEVAIGDVLEIYGSDPRHGDSCARTISFRPSEEGIDLLTHGAGAEGTIWVRFTLRPVLVSAVPFAPGHRYRRGNVVYDPEGGDCWRALVDNHDSNLLSPGHWLCQPIPFLLSTYLKAGAYADALRETDPTITDPYLLGLRLKAAAAADTEAETSLQNEMNRLAAQGDVRSYQRFARPRPRALLTAAA